MEVPNEQVSDMYRCWGVYFLCLINRNVYLLLKILSHRTPQTVFNGPPCSCLWGSFYCKVGQLITKRDDTHRLGPGSDVRLSVRVQSPSRSTCCGVAGQMRG